MLRRPKNLFSNINSRLSVFGRQVQVDKFRAAYTRNKNQLSPYVMKFIYSDRRVFYKRLAQHAKESTTRVIYLQIAAWRIIGCVNSIWFSPPSLVNILHKPRRAAVYKYIILTAPFLPLAPFSNLFYDRISIRSN